MPTEFSSSPLDALESSSTFARVADAAAEIIGAVLASLVAAVMMAGVVFAPWVTLWAITDSSPVPHRLILSALFVLVVGGCAGAIWLGLRPENPASKPAGSTDGSV